VHEPFDTLGGHSLHAVRLVNRIAEAFGVTVPLAVFFGPVTVAELARRPELAAGGAGTRPVPLPRAGDDPARPTTAQARYWFIDQFVADRSLYNVGTVFAIDGRLDVPALRATLTELMRDIGRLYPAIHDGGPPPPPPATPSWADIAAWEAAELSGPRLAALREFWAGTLRGVRELLDLPTDRARPAEPSYRGATT